MSHNVNLLQNKEKQVKRKDYTEAKQTPRLPPNPPVDTVKKKYIVIMINELIYTCN